MRNTAITPTREPHCHVCLEETNPNDTAITHACRRCAQYLVNPAMADTTCLVCSIPMNTHDLHAALGHKPPIPFFNGRLKTKPPST